MMGLALIGKCKGPSIGNLKVKLISWDQVFLRILNRKYWSKIFMIGYTSLFSY
jgi:hypothetical protein